MLMAKEVIIEGCTHPFLFPALSMIMFYKWVKLLLHRIDKKFYWEEIKSVLSDLIHRKLKGESLFFFQISFSLSLLQVRLLHSSLIILIPMLLPLIHPLLCLKPRPKMMSSFYHLSLRSWRRKLLNYRTLLRMIFCMMIFPCMSMMRLLMQVGI